MRGILIFGSLLLGLLVSFAVIADDAYINGVWYDGEKFSKREVYVVDGKISFVPPDEVNNTFDLAGAYVIPPFAEAHNHDLASDFEIDRRINDYLWDGVFYAKMQSAFSKGFGKLAPNFNKQDSVDVIFAFAPVTGPGGHPMSIRHLFFDRGYYDGVFESKEEISGIGYTLVETAKDLADKWPGLIDQKPDFIKFMLSYSEEYDLRRDDPEFFGRKGIDPSLVPQLVELAHAAGLEITAHVTTAADFHVAVTSGVDEVAHLPGDDDIQIIRSQDALVAAEKDVAIITTVSLTQKIKDDYPNYYLDVMEQHARNLQRLKDAGVRVLVGSDMPFRDTSIEEAFLLRGLGVFSDQELLNMWTETTPRSIFPKRKIGRFAEGFEASFLVLRGNPLEDFQHVRNIELRVKQGRQLTPMARESLN